MPYKILNYVYKKSNNKTKLQYPIVLLRGLGRSMSFWLEFEKELIEKSDMILIDLLGTGGSKDFLGRVTIKSFALDVLYTLKVNNIHSFYLSGISLGGMVCLEIGKLLKNKEWSDINLYALCVMASSSGGLGSKRIFMQPLLVILFSILISFIKGHPSHRLFSKYLITQNTIEENQNIVQKWDSIWKREYFSRMALIRQFLAAAFFKVDVKRVSQNVSILFIVSKHDKLVPWINSVLLWEKMPFAELKVLENLGHDMTTDNPILLSEILAEFFARNY